MLAFLKRLSEFPKDVEDYFVATSLISLLVPGSACKLKPQKRPCLIRYGLFVRLVNYYVAIRYYLLSKRATDFICSSIEALYSLEPNRFLPDIVSSI